MYKSEYDKLNREITQTAKKLKLSGNAYKEIMTQGQNIQGALLRNMVSDHKGVLFLLKHTI
jgi:hypothetical protein